MRFLMVLNAQESRKPGGRVSVFDFRNGCARQNINIDVLHRLTEGRFAKKLVLLTNKCQFVSVIEIPLLYLQRYGGKCNTIIYRMGVL
jgi:hypothetical protein